MEKRQELIRRIEREIGRFPCLSKIDKFIERRHGTATWLMEGMKPMRGGRGKKYSAVDVADRIIERLS